MRKRSHGPRSFATRPKPQGRPTPRARPRLAQDPASAQADRALAHAIALDIVRESTQQRTPADRILRSRLREARLESVAAAFVVRLVFSWFRWRGFLPGVAPEPEALARTLELADQYAADPARIPCLSLIDGAVPGWLRQHMQVREPFLRALQTEPVIWLRARPGKAREVASMMPLAIASPFPALADALRYTGSDDLFRSALFNQGRFEIQDIASQAVGIVCAPAPGETWWDACAGEGGKTLHLADLMQNRGLVWASDRSAARLGVLRKRAARAGLFNYRAVGWDGGERPPTRTRFDGVLVDAPCSGVGTWQRTPHARWMVGPADVRELAAVQLRLLTTAATAVKPDGRLIYSVCTLTHDETTAVSAAFSAAHPDFVPESFADPFDPRGSTRPEIAWEPQVTGGNGMYVAAWRRVSR